MRSLRKEPGRSAAVEPTTLESNAARLRSGERPRAQEAAMTDVPIYQADVIEHELVPTTGASRTP